MYKNHNNFNSEILSWYEKNKVHETDYCLIKKKKLFTQIILLRIPDKAIYFKPDIRMDNLKRKNKKCPPLSGY